MFNTLAVVSTILFIITTGFAEPYPKKEATSEKSSGSLHTPLKPDQPAIIDELAVSSPLTLNRCIEFALKHNPDIGAGTSAVHAAEAAAENRRGQRWPSLNAVGGYRSYLDPLKLIPSRSLGDPGYFTDQIVSGDLVLGMPLFTGGKIINEIQVSDLLKQAAESRLTRTKEEIIFNVSSIFYAILGQHRVIESVEMSKKVLAEHLKQVQALLSVGKAARVDLLRTEVNLADISQKLIHEKNILSIQKQILASLMGLDTGAENVPLRVEGQCEFVDIMPDLSDSMNKAFNNRSDYKAVKSELTAQIHRIKVAQAERWPNVSLQAAYGGRWAMSSTDKNTGADDSGDVGSAGIFVDIPIFEGGSINARIREEQARMSAEQERLRKLELNIRLDVKTAVLNVNSNRERALVNEKAIDKARESFIIEQEKYLLGKGSITDVLDAQSALLNAETFYYKALADLNSSMVQLKLATGEI